MSRAAIFLDMDDVPHLGEKEKKQILAGVPSWQLQARKSGIPGHGVGAIYPIPEDAMLVDPFDIPAHWLRSYGTVSYTHLDVYKRQQPVREHGESEDVRRPEAPLGEVAQDRPLDGGPAP